MEGTTIQAVSDLASAPRAMATAATPSQRKRSSARARVVAYTAATSRNINRVSGLLSRLMATTIGVTASSPAAMSPAGWPAHRDTVR